MRNLNPSLLRKSADKIKEKLRAVLGFRNEVHTKCLVYNYNVEKNELRLVSEPLKYFKRKGSKKKLR